MCVSLCIPAIAADSTPEKERVTITVNTLDDVRAFYRSSAYDDSKVYSFVILYHPESRALCPNCGKAAWTGQNHGVDELNPYFQECPGGAILTNDKAVVMYYHYLERCRNCGYEIDHSQYYFAITCSHDMPDFRNFEAWDGNHFDGKPGSCDVHEDKKSWWVVPSKYH